MAPRQRNKSKKTTASRGQGKTSRQPKAAIDFITTTREVTTQPQPAAAVDVVTTETELRTEPTVEIRRPATLAQALTEPSVAVMKPDTKVVARRIRTRRVA